MSCNGFFLGTAGDCHTVNQTNVGVATSLGGASYRRKRLGLTVVANTTRSVWLDITVPATAVPGLYTGSVAVKQSAAGASSSTTAQGEPQLLFTVPISLQVW